MKRLWIYIITLLNHKNIREIGVSDNMSMKVNPYLSKKIAHYMAILTLMVVFIHTSGSFRDKIYIGSFESGWDIFIEIIGQGITRVAVPLFFVISGVLAFSKENISEKLLFNGAVKRLRTLGLTYIIWNIINAIYHILCNIFIEEINILSQLSFFDIIDIIFNYRYNYAFWYVKQLLIISFLAPLIYKLIKSKRYFIVFAIITLTINLVYKYIPYMDIVFPGIFFYFLGAGISLHFSEIINKPRKKSIIIISLIALVIMQVFRVFVFSMYPEDVDRVHFLHRIYETITPVLFWYAFDFIPFDKVKVRFFEKHTFMVYASHLMPISIMSTNTVIALLHLYSSNIIISMSIFIIVSISIYMAITIFSYFLQRILPKVHSVLTGGR